MPCGKLDSCREAVCGVVWYCGLGNNTLVCYMYTTSSRDLLSDHDCTDHVLAMDRNCFPLHLNLRPLIPLGLFIHDMSSD